MPKSVTTDREKDPKEACGLDNDNNVIIIIISISIINISISIIIIEYPGEACGLDRAQRPRLTPSPTRAPAELIANA